jgi:glutamate synthase (ferredoxin)
MHGGRIIVKPFDNVRFDPYNNIIAGNVLLYGATGGEVYIRGRVGERFAVRNSNAFAVVEGAGDHCCEYMTGGCVVVLGSVGKNFGAGMSNGIAFVLDQENKFDKLYNPQMVRIQRINSDDEDLLLLKKMIENHYRYTGSTIAEEILNNFDSYLSLFWKVVPKSVEEIEKTKVIPDKQEELTPKW